MRQSVENNERQHNIRTWHQGWGYSVHSTASTWKNNQQTNLSADIIPNKNKQIDTNKNRATYKSSVHPVSYNLSPKKLSRLLLNVAKGVVTSGGRLFQPSSHSRSTHWNGHLKRVSVPRHFKNLCKSHIRIERLPNLCHIQPQQTTTHRIQTNLLQTRNITKPTETFYFPSPTRLLWLTFEHLQIPNTPQTRSIINDRTDMRDKQRHHKYYFIMST